jgi:hypothetical protein
VYAQMQSRVESIENDEEFVKRIEKAKEETSRVVVEFTATYTYIPELYTHTLSWCGPCKAIGLCIHL